LDRFNRFRISIEEFYANHQRELPWRKEKPVPYEVWLSEIILQQTRVAQGTPYFEKILAAFPTIKDLAEAPEDQLLSLWTGLGYYNRARNLRAGAKQVVEKYGGVLPTNAKELLDIKGIGPYTAAAIASICHGEKIGVVDGNVYRVLSRYFGVQTPTNSTAGIKEFQELANYCIEGTSDPKSYNQGIMEFGALQCTPKNPACMLCPLQSECEAFQSGLVSTLPVKLKKGKRSAETLHFAVIEKNGEWMLKKRDNTSIWAGLYEFPRLDQQPENGQLLAQPFIYKLSHKDLNCHFWSSNENQINEPGAYYSKEEMTKLGLPIVIANFVANKL